MCADSCINKNTYTHTETDRNRHIWTETEGHRHKWTVMANNGQKQTEIDRNKQILKETHDCAKYLIICTNFGLINAQQKKKNLLNVFVSF